MGAMSPILGRKVYLDTNIIVYAIEGYELYAASIQAILDAMDSGDIVAATSELTIAEVLVKPKQDQNEMLVNAYRYFLRSTAALSVVPISRSILEEAAQIRASSNLKLPDAIHLATASAQGCDSFLTNDRAFRAVPSFNVKILSELIMP
ncbi:MAG: type II toxin-antitoxin system VapC family toxin [Blastocatellia bacterium]|nr:type II toxin-antitoxin system VapC family toxin [Blastocatellia bacterium]